MGAAPSSLIYYSSVVRSFCSSLPLSAASRTSDSCVSRWRLELLWPVLTVGTCGLKRGWVLWTSTLDADSAGVSGLGSVLAETCQCHIEVEAIHGSSAIFEI